MSQAQPKPNWYLKDDVGVRGPLLESEMRELVKESADPGLMVRQGTSDWHPAESLRRKMKELAEKGFYVRFKRDAEGPFTLSRTYEMLRDNKIPGVLVRSGNVGDWVPAEQWISAVSKLHQRKRKPERASGDDSAGEDAQNDIPSAIPIEEIAQAILVEDDGVLEAVPVANVLEARVAEPRGSSTNIPNANILNARPQTWPDQTEYPSQKRIRSAKSSSGGLALKLVGAAVAVLLLIVVLVLKFSPIMGTDNSLQPSGGLSNSNVKAAKPAPPTDSRLTRRRLVPREETDNQARSDQAGATNGAQPTLAQPTPLPSEPPKVVSGMLFRPTFSTTDGTIDAGTAFAAQISGDNRTYLLTAKHLFGSAGGLSRELSSSVLKVKWKGLSLRDCQSGDRFEHVQMKPLALAARGFPERSTCGDVVACVVLKNPRQESPALQPLTLSGVKPSIGEKVWLISAVIGSDALVHEAKVDSFDDDWLVYRFAEHPELRATSGAPVVNGYGKVVAINAGGGQDGGNTFGVGTTTTQFIKQLKFAR